MRHGAQAAHDAADAERVGDGLAQAVFLRHFEIGDGAGLVAADLESNDDEIGAFQRLALVGIGLNPWPWHQASCKLAGDDLGFSQAFRIDVHQGDRRAGQRGALQDVADDVLHEHGRAGADEGDFGISAHFQFSTGLSCDFKGRSNELLRVVGFGLGEDFGHGPLLDDLAVLHDNHAVAERAHHLEVVAR